MAKLVYIVGKSGSGKSTSIRNFNPLETVVINSDAKSYPFKGFEKNYNDVNKNYLRTSDVKLITKVLTSLNDRKEVKRVVIDTWSRTMTDHVMGQNFRKDSGFDKWAQMSGMQYDLISLINNSLRDDLIVYLFAHPESYFNDIGLLSEKISTPGKQLEKLVPESFSSIVLYTEVSVMVGKDPEFMFRTKTNGADTCKTPMSMFEATVIPNDLNEVEHIIRAYYE